MVLFLDSEEAWSLSKPAHRRSATPPAGRTMSLCTFALSSLILRYLGSFGYLRILSNRRVSRFTLSRARDTPYSSTIDFTMPSGPFVSISLSRFSRSAARATAACLAFSSREAMRFSRAMSWAMSFCFLAFSASFALRRVSFLISSSSSLEIGGRFVFSFSSSASPSPHPSSPSSSSIAPVPVSLLLEGAGLGAGLGLAFSSRFSGCSRHHIVARWRLLLLRRRALRACATENPIDVNCTTSLSLISSEPPPLDMAGCCCGGCVRHQSIA
mmetsp:Transcript_38602/g.74905  ORF Transcript_38602/g.74905 Transcript_38602/m.74905 type:complete len:270 (+) Transcript_38602:956-1765(+)